MTTLLRHAHALVRPQLARYLRISVQRLPDVRGDRGRSLSPGELGCTTVEFDERALHLLLVRLLRERAER